MTSAIIFKISLKASVFAEQDVWQLFRKESCSLCRHLLCVPLTSALHSTLPASLPQDSDMLRARKQVSNQESFLQRKVVPLHGHENTKKHMELQ